MTPNRRNLRSYQDVLDDLNAAHDSLRKATRATAAGAGDKRVERNLKQIKATISHLNMELTLYDPITGLRRGRKIFRGAPCG